MFLALVFASSALVLLIVAFNRVAKGHIWVAVGAVLVAVFMAGIAGALAA
jgi:hypothetical protein